MKFFFKSKDGGPESNVTGYWLFESKRFGSVVLLCFAKGSREAFHSHAFNSVGWVLKGQLVERIRGSYLYIHDHLPSFKPIYVPKSRMHQVEGITDKTWVLNIRGPWDKTWKEYLPAEDREITLTNGRIVIEC